MPNTISTSMMVPGAPSISQLEQREVGDEVRYLGIGNSTLTALIENSFYKDGKRNTSKGLISKRAVNNERFEMYSRLARPYKVTVASGTEVETTGITLNDANGVEIPMTIYNPTSDTRFRVEYKSGNVLKGSSIGATFSAAAGDELVVMAPANKAGSTATMVINGTDDQNFNMLQHSRWAVSISWVLEAMKELAGGKRLPREKMILLWEALADQERTMLLGESSADRATKNTTTGVQTGYAHEYPTTRGLLKLAGNSISANGAANLSWLRKKLPIGMGEYVNDKDTYIGLCSNEYFWRVVDEMNNKVNIDNSGEMKMFGIKATEIVTAGPNIKLVKHNVFNVKGLETKMLVMAPQNVGYVYLQGHDMGPNNGIQENATHGTTDEIYGSYGIETLDAGKTLTLVTNLF